MRSLVSPQSHLEVVHRGIIPVDRCSDASRVGRPVLKQDNISATRQRKQEEEGDGDREGEKMCGVKRWIHTLPCQVDL